MLDLSPTIVAKSNQLNADDLIGRSLSVTVTDVKLVTGDQPVAIHYEGDNGKPYLPCKSMRRVIIRAWGNDGNQYRGRRMTLYRDENVTFGGQNVGGIRISHMSHIDKPLTLSLTVSRNSRKPYTVQPLPAAKPVEQTTDDRRAKAEQWVAARTKALNECTTMEAFSNLTGEKYQNSKISLKTGAIDLLTKLEAAEMDAQARLDNFDGDITPPGGSDDLPEAAYLGA